MQKLEISCLLQWFNDRENDPDLGHNANPSYQDSESSTHGIKLRVVGFALACHSYCLFIVGEQST